jgi:DNA-binding NarL/FixJ family response regulator
MQIKLIIADDHHMIRMAVRLMVERQLSLSVLKIENAASCSELLDKLKKEKYTHLVLDLNMSDGSSLEILSTIRRLYPVLRIMILSMGSSNIYRKATEGCGVYYFCSKVDPERETMSVFRRFFDDTGLQRAATKEFRDFNPFAVLTKRDLEILHYILKGASTNQISSVLNVRSNTVSSAKRKIFDKTNTSNVVELSELASLYLGKAGY